MNNPPPATSSERNPDLPSARDRPARASAVILACALLTICTAIVFSPVLRFDFVNFDDPVYVTENSQVLNGMTAEGARWAFTNLEAGFWQPLTWLSYMLDHHWFGASASGFHRTNLLLHIGNTLLLFLVLHQMTRALWRSAFVAALFALHPLHVESVAWVAQRKDVLSTWFWMLALWAYGRYAEVRNPKSEIRSSSAATFYLLTLLFFACGLMSKTMVVTLPLVLLLLDVWPLKRVSIFGFPGSKNINSPANANTKLTTLIVEKAPLFAAALFAGLVTIRAEGEAGALSSAIHYPLGDRLSNAALSLTTYLAQTFWPANMTVFYPYPKMFSPASVAGAAGLVLVLSIIAFLMRRRWSFFTLGWFWFLVTLLPVLGLIQVGAHARADRYTYIPLIGIFIIVAWGAGELLRWARIPKTMASLAAILIVALCAARTTEQLTHWRNSETLFRHALAVTKDNFVAHNNLGTHLYERGNIAEALKHFRESLRLQPDFVNARHNFGVALFHSGETEAAIREYRQVLSQKPDSFTTWDNLGNALAKQGALAEAERCYREALRVRPDHATAAYNLANLLADQKRYAEAITNYQSALKARPTFAEAHFNLAITLIETRRTNDALRHINEVLRLNAADAELHFNLGHLLAQLGRRDEAIRQIKKGLELKPGDADGTQQLRALEGK